MTKVKTGDNSTESISIEEIKVDKLSKILTNDLYVLYQFANDLVQVTATDLKLSETNEEYSSMSEKYSLYLHQRFILKTELIKRLKAVLG